MHAAADGDDREQPAADRPTHGPRNFLARRERRRLFWWVMPPAVAAVLLLGWLERSWKPSPAVRVDTLLAGSGQPVLGPGDVQVEQPPEPEPESESVVRSAETLSAPSELLALIKDETFHRKEEVPAWIQTMLTLRSSDPQGLRAATQPVGFGELFGQPRSFRGRPVRFSGKVRSLERRTAPANDYGIAHYHEAWVEPADGTSAPIVVHALDVPAEIEPAGSLGSVDVDGYFFKNFAYLARDHQLRRAPLVLAATLRRRPPEPVAALVYHGGHLLGYTLLAVAVATVAAVVGFGFGLIGPTDGRRRVEGPADLEATLAAADIISPAEALRRLEVDHRAAAAEQSAEVRSPSS